MRDGATDEPDVHLVRTIGASDEPRPISRSSSDPDGGRATLVQAASYHMEGSNITAEPRHEARMYWTTPRPPPRHPKRLSVQKTEVDRGSPACTTLQHNQSRLPLADWGG